MVVKPKKKKVVAHECAAWCTRYTTENYLCYRSWSKKQLEGRRKTLGGSKKSSKIGKTREAQESRKKKKKNSTINPSYLKRLIRVSRSCILCMVSEKSRLNCVCTTCGPKHLFQVKQSYTTFGCINQTANILTGEFLYKGFLVINQPAKEVADFARSPFPFFLGEWRKKQQKKILSPISFHVECHCWYEIFFTSNILCFFISCFSLSFLVLGKIIFLFVRNFFFFCMFKEKRRSEDFKWGIVLKLL